MKEKPLYRIQREYEEDEAWKWVTGRPNHFAVMPPARPFVDEGHRALGLSILFYIEAILLFVGGLAILVYHFFG